MSKHTLGPWIVGPANKGPVAGTIPVHTADYMESYRGGQLVCSVYGTAAFSDANARLISAAPDLLEALQSVLDNCMDSDGLAEAYTKARAAIAKATGGSND